MKKGKRILALFLAFAMVATSVNLSGWTTVKAGETKSETYYRNVPGEFKGSDGIQVTHGSDSALNSAEGTEYQAPFVTADSEGKLATVSSNATAGACKTNRYGCLVFDMPENMTITEDTVATVTLNITGYNNIDGSANYPNQWFKAALYETTNPDIDDIVATDIQTYYFKNGDYSYDAAIWSDKKIGTTGEEGVIKSGLITFDVTDAFKSAYGVNNYLVLRLMIPRGGMNFNAYNLIIDTPTTATINYVDTNGNAVKDSQAVDVSVGSTYTYDVTANDAKSFEKDGVTYVRDTTLDKLTIDSISETTEDNIITVGYRALNEGEKSPAIATYSFNNTLESNEPGTAVTTVGNYGSAITVDKISYSEGRDGTPNGSVQLGSYGLKLNKNNFGENYTVNVWVKSINSDVKANRTILFLGSNVDPDVSGKEKWASFARKWDNNETHKVWGSTTDGTNGNEKASFILPTDKWTMLTLAQSGNNLTAYVNGKEIANVADMKQVLVGENQDIYLGVTNFNDSIYQGYYDDLSIYDRQMSASEIAYEYLTSISDETEKANFIKDMISDLVLNGNKNFNKVTKDLSLPTTIFDKVTLAWTATEGNKAIAVNNTTGTFLNGEGTASEKATLTFTASIDDTPVTTGTFDVTAATAEVFAKEAFAALGDDGMKAVVDAQLSKEIFLNGNTSFDKVYTAVKPITAITYSDNDLGVETTVATVEWTSNPTGVIDPATGNIITANKFATDVTMTATVKYNGETVADWGKEYKLIVEQPTTYRSITVGAKSAESNSVRSWGDLTAETAEGRVGALNICSEALPSTGTVVEGTELAPAFVDTTSDTYPIATVSGSGYGKFYNTGVMGIQFDLSNLTNKREIKTATVKIHAIGFANKIADASARMALFKVDNSIETLTGGANINFPALNNDYSYASTIFSNEMVTKNTNGDLTFDITKWVKESIDAKDTRLNLRLQAVVANAFVYPAGDEATEPKLIINYKEDISAAEMAEADLKALTVEENGTTITNGFTLPTVGTKNNSSIAWTAATEDGKTYKTTPVTIDANGNVTVVRPEASEGDAVVTLIPSATCKDEDGDTAIVNGSTDIDPAVTFTVTVKAYPTLASHEIANISFDTLSDDGSAYVDKVNGVKATINGKGITASTTDSMIGNAVSLSNADRSSYLNVTNTDGTPLLSAENTEITISYYSKPSSSDNAGWSFFTALNANKPDTNTDGYAYIGMLDLNTSVKLERRFNGKDSGTVGKDKPSVAQNNWAKIDVVLANDKTTVYVNGDPIGNESSIYAVPDCVGATSADRIFWLGKSSWVPWWDNTGTNEYFTGLLDEFKVYNTAFTADEIAHTYALESADRDLTALENAVEKSILGNNASMDYIKENVTFAETVNGKHVSYSVGNDDSVIDAEGKIVGTKDGRSTTITATVKETADAETPILTKTYTARLATSVVVNFVDEEDNVLSSKTTNDLKVNDTYTYELASADVLFTDEAGNFFERTTTENPSITLGSDANVISVEYKAVEIEEITAPTVHVIEGNAPILPKKVTAKVGSVTTQLAVKWDEEFAEYDAAKLHVGNDNKVTGTVKTAGDVTATIVVYECDEKLADVGTVGSNSTIYKFAKTYKGKIIFEYDIETTGNVTDGAILHFDSVPANEGAVWGAGGAMLHFKTNDGYFNSRLGLGNGSVDQTDNDSGNYPNDKSLAEKNGGLYDGKSTYRIRIEMDTTTAPGNYHIYVTDPNGNIGRITQAEGNGFRTYNKGEMQSFYAGRYGNANVLNHKISWQSGYASTLVNYVIPDGDSTKVDSTEVIKELPGEHSEPTLPASYKATDGTVYYLDSTASNWESGNTSSAAGDELVYNAVYVEGTIDSQKNEINLETRAGIVPELPETTTATITVPAGTVDYEEPITWSDAAKAVATYVTNEDGSEKEVIIKGYFTNNTNVEVTATVTVSTLESHLMAHYAFDESTDATEFADSTGNKAVATEVDSVTTETGLSGNAVSLPGGGKNTGSVKLPDNLIQKDTNSDGTEETQDDFTISMFMKKLGTGNSFAMILHGTEMNNESPKGHLGFINRSGGNPDGHFSMEYRSDGTTKGLVINEDIDYQTPSNEWIHVAIVTKGSTGEAWLYENGKLMGYEPDIVVLPSSLTAQNNYLGKSTWYWDSDWQGMYDEFKVYDTALTEKEVKDICDETLYDLQMTKTKEAIQAMMDDADTDDKTDANGKNTICTISEDLDIAGLTYGYGATVEWSSTDTDLISTSGTVLQPSKGETNGAGKTTTLEAKVTVNGITNFLTYTVTVPESDKVNFKVLNNAIAAAQAKLDAAVAEKKYSDASLKVWEDAIATAQAVADTENAQTTATYQEVNAAAAALTKALEDNALILAEFDELNEKALTAWYPLTTDAKDASGKGNDATAHDVLFDRDNGAIFNGGEVHLAHYIEVPTNVIENKDQLTISFWAYDRHGKKSNIFGFSPDDSASVEAKNRKHFLINTSDPANYLRVTMNERGWSTADGVFGENEALSFPANTWTHITAVLDNKTITVYKNGVFAGTDEVTMKVSDLGDLSYVYLGDCAYEDANYFGYVKDFRVYDTVLEASQVKAVYDEMDNYKVSYAVEDLKAALKLNEDGKLVVTTDTITLPSSVETYPEVNIKWTSLTETVDPATGKVTLPEFGKTSEATLNVELSLNGAKDAFAVPVLLSKTSTTVTFNLDGGKGNIADQVVEYNGKVTKPAADPTKEDYEFAGWYFGDEEYDFDKAVTTEPIEITAKWNRIEYTVTFDANTAEDDSDVTKVTVYSGDKATKPADPVKEGYDFLGWFRKDATNAFNFNTIIKGNVELTAKWEISKYDVTFDADNGTEETTEIVEHGKLATKPADPAKTGHTFKFWSADGKTAYDFTKAVTSDVTLTAIYDINKYTVAFDADGGIAVLPQTVEYNKKAAEPVTSKEGYTFAGWYLDGKKYDFDTPVTGDIELKAKWDIITYTVTFVDIIEESGRNIKTTATTDITKNYLIEETTPSELGWNFKGWITDDGKAFDFATKVTEDITLTAVWEIDLNFVRHDVTFIADGKTFKTLKVVHGAATNVPTEIPEKPDHNFLYWSLTVDGDAYDFSTLVNDDLTLYAVFEVAAHDVTFDADNGTEPVVVEVKHNAAVDAPKAPAKAGYVFGGWMLDGKAYDFSAPVTTDITLTAAWIVDTAALEAAVKAAEALVRADYKTASWNAMKAVLADAKAELADANHTVETVAAAAKALNNAVKALVKRADMTALTTAIKTAETADETAYTTASWAPFAAALAAAKELAKDLDAEQADVNAKADALIVALGELVVLGDKTELNAAIAAAKALTKADYTEESYAAVDTAVKAAEAVVADTQATQDTVDAAAAAIDEAVAALVTKVAAEKDTLTETVDAAEATLAGLKEADYTAASWKAVVVAIDNAKYYVNNRNTTLAEIDAAKAAIADALAGMKTLAEEAEEKAVVEATEAVEATKAEVAEMDEALYTADSWKAVADAIKAAEKAIADKNTSDEINAANEAIKEAVEALVLQADEDERLAKEEAIEAITAEIEKTKEAVAKLAEKDYTAASWKALQDAIAAAEAIVENEEATSADVTAANKAMTAALAGLEKAKPATVNVSSITLTDSIGAGKLQIAKKKTVKLTADVAPQDATNKAVTWTSSNDKVATVAADGTVKAVKAGTATITATAADGSGVKASVTIKVMNGTVKKVTIKGKKTVNAGKKLKLTGKVTKSGKANTKLIWTSSNEEWATVNSKGQVKTTKAGKGKTVTITAMSTDGTNKKAKIKVKIK